MRVPLRKIDFAVYIVCFLVIFMMVLYCIVAWNKIPKQIPSHYDFSGSVRGYEGRAAVLSAPITLIVLVPVLIIVSFFPAAWNFPRMKVTQRNAPAVSACVRNMLDIMMLLVTATLGTIFVCQVTEKLVPAFFLPVLLALYLVNIVFWLIRVSIVNRRIMAFAPAEENGGKQD